MANFLLTFLSLRHNNKHLVCVLQCIQETERIQIQIQQWKVKKTNLQIHGQIQRA